MKSPRLHSKCEVARLIRRTWTGFSPWRVAGRISRLKDLFQDTRPRFIAPFDGLRITLPLVALAICAALSFPISRISRIANNSDAQVTVILAIAVFLAGVGYPVGVKLDRLARPN